MKNNDQGQCSGRGSLYTRKYFEVRVDKFLSPSACCQLVLSPRRCHQVELVRNRNFLNKVIRSEVKIGRGQIWWSRRSRQFSKHDTTTLGDIQIRAKFYCPIKNEYFLDRHRPSFQAVLDYYQTGLLRRPDEIPLDVMINELKFYRLDETAIEDFLKSECILKSGFIRILALHRCRWQLLQATCGSDNKIEILT